MQNSPTTYTHGTGPVALPGGFISNPEAFAAAEPSRQDVVKIMFRPAVRDGGICLEFSTDALVVDFGLVDPETLNVRRIAADCDLVKRIALAHPSELKDALTAMQLGTDEGIERAAKILTGIGFTEEEAVKDGGGLICVIVAVGLALLAGGCAHLNSNKPFKASTMPRAPVRTGGGDTPPPQ